MTCPVSFTLAASNYIQDKITKNNHLGFRLSVKKTGCSGYSYLPALIDEINLTDQTFELANGAKIFIDTTWLHLLEGVQVDYVEEEKSGLKQKRLVFSNPNESSRCGCGESFHVE